MADTEPDVSTKRCSTCAEDIRLQARKCTKCGSYQDARRYLAGWAATVSVVAAFVSVGVALSPHIKALSTPKFAEPEVALVGAAPGILTVAVRNRGAEAIYVDSGALNFGRGRSTTFRPLTMLQRGVVGVMIPGQQTRPITFLIDGGIEPFSSAESVCMIYVSYGTTGDKVNAAIQRLSCPRLAALDPPRAN